MIGTEGRNTQGTRKEGRGLAGWLPVRGSIGKQSKAKQSKGRSESGPARGNLFSRVPPRLPRRWPRQPSPRIYIHRCIYNVPTTPGLRGDGLVSATTQSTITQLKITNNYKWFTYSLIHLFDLVSYFFVITPYINIKKRT